MWTTLKAGALAFSLLATVPGPARTVQEVSSEPNFLTATEIIDATIVRHLDDGGTRPDVRNLFKGEYVPKELRGVIHDDSESGRMG